MSEIKVLILTGYGLNCDYETAHAFTLAGAKPGLVHINDLIDGVVSPDDFQIMVFGGGFSWGDDHGAGVIEAVRLKTNIGDKIYKFIDDGKLIIGICNGFQCLVNLGLLPGLDCDYTKRSVALMENDCGNFRDQWVNLKINPKSPCVFTKGFSEIELPVRHGEGKFYCEKSILEKIKNNNQDALWYARPGGEAAGGEFPYNPNGSLCDIAGICDPTGRIFGLMPHPEAYNHPFNHPDWIFEREKKNRKNEKYGEKITPGIKLFKNGVEYFKLKTSAK